MPHAMKTADDALHAILHDLRPLGAESVDVVDAAGRVLAEDVVARTPLPPWDNSAMDGYAFRAADAQGGKLRVSATVAAGADVGQLEAGTAARIMTGAPVPAGADTVLMREETDESDPARVVLKRIPGAGENIRRRGDDVAAGSTVLVAGRGLTPADVGLLCAVGRVRVRVVRRPVVAILSTGDELSELGDPPHPSRIVNSNAWMLAAQVRQSGAIPRVLGIAADQRAALAARLREAAGADVLLTSGGVSAGDFDFVGQALADAGTTLDFWKVAIRPGKPLAVGRMGQTRVFGLPGNPVSAFVTFEVFVRPALRALSGMTPTTPRTVEARLASPVSKKSGLTFYVRVGMSRDGDAYVATPRTQQSSGALTSISGADGLAVLDASMGDVPAGERVPVMVLDDSFMRR